ncbi:MAG: hypothetical protein GY820_39130 [Gammaproteobacteria bacterium]|nr:hypothetical protein [Gammaproteobacteria bacterium]
MAKVKVQFELAIPDHVGENDFREWLEFEVGAKSSMSTSNPIEYAELHHFIVSKSVVIDFNRTSRTS